MPLKELHVVYDKCYLCKNICKKAPVKAPGRFECEFNPQPWEIRFAMYESSMMRMTTTEISRFILACRQQRIEPADIIFEFVQLLYTYPNSRNWNDLVQKARGQVEKSELESQLRMTRPQSSIKPSGAIALGASF